MKKLTIGLVLIIWFIFTMLLVVSLFGLVLFAGHSTSMDFQRSTWMEIGFRLVDALVN